MPSTNPPFSPQQRLALAQTMELKLYEQYSFEEAAKALGLENLELDALIASHDIGHVALPSEVRFFGFQLVDYLFSVVEPAKNASSFSHKNLHTTLVRFPTVQQMTGLSRMAICRLMEKRMFPKPISGINNTEGWKLTDIEKWLAEQK